MKSHQAVKFEDVDKTTDFNPQQPKNIHSAAVLALVTSLIFLPKSKFPETLLLDYERLSRIQHIFHSIITTACMLATIKGAIFETENVAYHKVGHVLGFMRHRSSSSIP